MMQHYEDKGEGVCYFYLGVGTGRVNDVILPLVALCLY